MAIKPTMCAVAIAPSGRGELAAAHTPVSTGQYHPANSTLTCLGIIPFSNPSASISCTASRPRAV